MAATAVHGGCSMISTSGPASAYVLSGQLDPESLPYTLVKLTPEVVAILERNSMRIGRMFTDRRGTHGNPIGTGDVVSVTLFESAAGGLFIPLEAGVRPGNFVTLPNQAVDTQGNITVPVCRPNLGQGEDRGRGSEEHRQRAQGPCARTAGRGRAGRSACLLPQRAWRSRNSVPPAGEPERRAIARRDCARRGPEESRLRHLGHARSCRTPGARAVCGAHQ